MLELQIHFTHSNALMTLVSIVRDEVDNDWVALAGFGETRMGRRHAIAIVRYNAESVETRPTSCDTMQTTLTTSR